MIIINRADAMGLAQLYQLKQRLGRVGAVNLDYGGQTKSMPLRTVLRFDNEELMVTPEQIVAFVQKRPDRRKVTPEGKLVIQLAPFEDPREILQQAQDLVDELILLRLRRAG